MRDYLARCLTGREQEEKGKKEDEGGKGIQHARYCIWWCDMCQGLGEGRMVGSERIGDDLEIDGKRYLKVI